MTRLSPDVRAVVAAVDRLTTQVARLADARQTPTDDAPTTNGRPVVGIDPSTEPSMVVAQWIPEPPGAAEHRARVQEWAAQVTRQAPAADDDAQRTTRRQSLRIILDRASRGVILRSDEAALLRQHVAAEQRDADTARAALSQAQAAIDRVRALADEYATSDERWRPSARLTGQVFRSALDGTEQPTTKG